MINRTAKTRHTRRHKPHGETVSALIVRLAGPPLSVRTDTVELPRLIATTAASL